MSTPHRFFLLAAALIAAPVAAQQPAPLHPALPTPSLPAFGSQLPDADFRLPPAEKKIPPTETSTAGFFVREVRFTGNTRIDSETLATLAAPFVNRRLGAGDIEELRLRVSRLYIDAGYINSGAVLNPGAFDNGVLTLSIIEGSIGFVRLRGLDRLHENYVVDRLIPDQDAPLNINELRERFQLLLADPLFAQAQARLIPDSQPGRAILDIDAVRARPYQLTFYGNNYRTASLGEKSAGLTGWVRNLSGYGDYLELGLQQGEGSVYDNQRRSLLWTLPLGSHGTEFGLSADSARATVLEQPLKNAHLLSTQSSQEIRLSQRIFESLQQRFSIGLAYGQRVNRSYLAGIPFSFQPGETNGVTRVESWRWWQEYAHRWEEQALVLRSTFAFNHNNLQGGAANPERSNLTWLGQAHFARRLDESTQFSARATVQRTGETLPGMDRLAIGGYQSVRGFRENLLLQDRGEFLNLDLERVVWRNDSASFSLGVFHDLGGGSSRGGPRSNLNASGITVKGQYGRLSAELAWALRRERPPGTASNGDSLQDHGIHFQIAWKCFD